RKPVTEPMAGWRNAAIMAGHWALHGFGMFVLEEKSSGKFVGRAGPFYPPVWPGFEVGWGIANAFRGKGYAVEWALPSIDWSLASFDLDEIVHVMDAENSALKSVARMFGALNEGETMLFSLAVDLWVTRRSKWAG